MTQTTRKICFSLSNDDFESLRRLLPHGTQDKLFAKIAVSLIPKIKAQKSLVLGGILSGELEIELKLKEKESK